MELKIYENPDHTLYAIKNDDANYFIETDGGFIRESDNMNNNDLLSWAEFEDISSDEYCDGNRDVNYEELRKIKEARDDVDYLSYPGGRAYMVCFDYDLIPDEIPVDFVEGMHPGDNAVYFIARNYEALVKLQDYIEEIGKKINFEIKQHRL